MAAIAALKDREAIPALLTAADASDSRFEAENEQLNQELSRAGISHVFRLYDGGHDQRLWGVHAPQWLGLALAHLARAQ
jgi:enterochelin esterase-like enzyme